MTRAATSYDPFSRDEARELEQSAAAREEHTLWSFDQASHGRPANQRENVGTWISLAPLAPRS